MIKGIGIDIIEIARVRAILARQPRFLERILTEHERKVYTGLKSSRRVEFFAGRFAAKEAFSKAFGTGIGESLSFLNIEIATDPNGRPYIEKPFSDGVHLSITHSREYAAAQVVIEEF
ncbi:holo-ACP synthase [Peribacillus cavernae]|uniref:Holo-[acyl-carrier-protein] synthase n=1 Tax=Peribacillus cavernae TaxID=1674310 RepID=A0A3S0UAI8_9BACI|nr:holo-ACP synthase [Peribacillus cavernae]MDQ0221329.1 holo-[acyl-carrier protein] synthase [Peribacillus cavernae]RUQ26974.1 holo-ACP synthase [Peribacillus cavernae]